MSDPRLDALAEAARNRGLLLVRSRVRTPGKPRFGKAGLADASGKPVFGMDGEGPTATPEAIEDYLRDLEAKDWGASLDARGQSSSEAQSKARIGGAPRARAARSPLPRGGRANARPEPAPRAKPAPKPELPPIPKIRKARPGDAARVAELIGELGHDIDADQVRRNLLALIKRDEVPLVATLGGTIVGLCGIERRIVISRPAPIARLSAVIVTRSAQGHGIGRMLVEAAEAWMRENGCALVELTSNDRRAEAHAFYRHLGYERTSIRFAKTL